MSDQSAKTVVVTGGTGGIGFATAKLLVERGYNVVAGDRDEAKPEQRGYAEGTDGRLSFIQCNASDSDDVEKMIDLAEAQPGRVTGLVNALGIEIRRRFIDVEMSEIRETMEANLIGLILPSQTLVRRWIDAAEEPPSPKSIVHISSVNALIASSTGHTSYGSSKGAVAQLTRVMGVELAPYNIRVNAIGPGSVRTRLMDRLIADQPNALDRVMARTPMNRMGEPEEIASATAFFLSEDASYVTGQTLYVDGGRTAQNLPNQ